MAVTDDLINFDLIETHKENIQSLPGGRSARQLVSILSPPLSTKTGSEPTFNETKNLNDAIRQEYETELLSIADSDDPLDIYTRYVKWTLNAYPSAQATPQSQLLPLLERATKAFLTSPHYKNDPRYLKLWLHYIRLFSDTPRETFAFLARHHIGESLSLFYEEFAVWLESAGRWNQADEVFRLGIEREARPAERLMRKYNQFQQRYEARPCDSDEPSSPALPTVRPALATKVDPFASTPRSNESHSQGQGSGGAATKPKSGKPKMAIFSDADNVAPPAVASNTNGWDSIGSIQERKKENTVEARPWTGETLKAGKRVGTVQKMEIFKDPSSQSIESELATLPKPSDVVNPRTGRLERVYVDLESIYPSSTEEYSFEELRAMKRGWMDRNWPSERQTQLKGANGNVDSSSQQLKATESTDVENLTGSFQEKLDLHETSTQSLAGMPTSKMIQPKKTKHREIRQETQTVKTRLDSPTSKKVKRKASAPVEPTMTLHSKAAMNDIYNIFNHSRKETVNKDVQSGDEADNGDDTYSTAGESEFADDTTKSFALLKSSSQPDQMSPWSEAREFKAKSKGRHKKHVSDDLTGEVEYSENPTMGDFDTQAIAALANQDFGDLDTKMIAQLAGDVDETEELESHDVQGGKEDNHHDDTDTHEKLQEADLQDLQTPVEGSFDQFHQVEIHEKPRFVPIPPEDYEPTPIRSCRDPTGISHNKLPFMTPIFERTESSLAPSTVFHNPDYFTSDMPEDCDTDGRNDSPSRLQVSNLLLSSPAQESPSSSKRRRSLNVETLAQEDHGSPPKKPVFEVEPSENDIVPFAITKVETLTPIFTPLSQKQAHDSSVSFGASKKQSKTLKPIHSGPIILDSQCNPCDEMVRKQILEVVDPPVSSYRGYSDCSEYDFGHYNALKAYVVKPKREGARSSPRKSQNDKTLTKAVPSILTFTKTDRVYAVKKELGQGAYAPVYLVDSYRADDTGTSPFDNAEDRPTNQSCDSRGELEALKTESPPLTLTWEFHILHLVQSRLGDASRAMSSIIKARECHLYRDECYLVLDYHNQGTLLDLVNAVRADNSRAGKTAEGLEETVAMWLSVELLRTMDEIWRAGLLHGDLKIDNCLSRFGLDTEVATPYRRDGSQGWSEHGLVLIDFGRGIDTKAFRPDAKFVADWKAEESDCAEIREARPWKYEIDLFGAAGIMHSLLFGKYIETVATGGGGLGQKKEWKLRESLKRYWERDIWSEVFGVLINGGKLNDVEEVRREALRVRTLMEDWLETEGERAGRDLRGAIRRCERLIKLR